MEYLVIGKVVNVHGIKGEIKIYCYSDDIENLKTLKEIYLEKDNKLTSFEVNKMSSKGNVLIVKLKGINSIEQAETLLESMVKRARNDEELEEDTYYVVDLINCKVITVDGVYIGMVEDVLKHGSADIYSIKKEDGKTILIPAIKQVIKNIDIKEKKIIIEMLEGLE